MAGMIPFRLGKDYTMRFDTLVQRLGLKRPLLVRNLLSLDPVLIDDIAAKAKSLRHMDIFDTIAKNDKKYENVPNVITIRLDEEQERRFNTLVASLGVGTKVQVLRNLLSGDECTITTICTKAKSIPPAPKGAEVRSIPSPDIRKTTEIFEPTDTIDELVRKKVSEFEKELRAILAEQRVVPNNEGMIPGQESTPVTEPINAVDEQSDYSDDQPSDKRKRDRKKKPHPVLATLKQG